MLVLDFDGVLLNSLDDVVLTGYNAATDETMENLSELPKDYVELLRLNRFHCQPAGDFILLARALLDGKRPSNQSLFSKEEYLSIVQGHKASLRGRTKDFFEARQRLIEKDESLWLRLNSVYQPLWEEVTKKASRVVLLTNKNSDSVLRSCKHAGLFLEPNNVYSGDGGVSKQENLVEILGRFTVKQIEFIDDSIKNLTELSKFAKDNLDIKFIGMLANWGFTGPTDAEQALELGFEVRELEEFSLYLKNHSLS
jgi:FMN phosphatase YigB (HAD superfamily)